MALFADWLYRGVVKRSNTQHHLDALYDLYIFAEMIQETQLMNQTIDAIQETCATYDRLIEPELLLHVWSKVVEDSRLWHWTLGLYIYRLGVVEEKMHDMVISELWEIAKFDHDSFARVVNWMVEAKPFDIRQRNKENQCDFHHHGKGEKCYLENMPQKKFHEWESEESLVLKKESEPVKRSNKRKRDLVWSFPNAERWRFFMVQKLTQEFSGLRSQGTTRKAVLGAKATNSPTFNSLKNSTPLSSHLKKQNLALNN